MRAHHDRAMRDHQRRVAVVGATGIAGQQFVAALERHPWFRLPRLGASSRSAGKSYGEALRDASTGQVRWWASEEPTTETLALAVELAPELRLDDIDIVFS